MNIFFPFISPCAHSCSVLYCIVAAGNIFGYILPDNIFLNHPPGL